MSSAMPELVERLVLDGTKVGWYPDRIAAWQRGEKIAPITVDCATTRSCNVACSFCYASLQANDGGKITKDQFFGFLEDAAEIGVKGVSFISDGESTVTPWYADAIEHAAKCGLSVGAGSNGIKLTRDVLQRILPRLSYLRFNFSAGEKHRYSAIMGTPQHNFDVVVQNIKDGMEIIRRDGLRCSLNMQLVCDPKDGDQIIPFAKLVAEVRPVYGVIKHAADSVTHDLGIDYSKYESLKDDMLRAEEIGREAGVRISVKWGRLDGQRRYSRCFGPPFLLQVSGSGLVAPCGFHFNSKYAKFHIGRITEKRFKDIWLSDRYDEVMAYLASDAFDPRAKCGPNCLQHNTCDFLYEYVNGRVSLPMTPAPPDLAFI